MRFTLPVKFGLLYSAISFGGVIAVTLSFYLHSADLLERQSLSRMADDLNRERSIIKERLEILSEDARLFSSSLAVRKIIGGIKAGGISAEEDVGLKAHVASQFTAFLNNRRYYLDIRFIGLPDNGREIVRVERVGSSIHRIPEAELQAKWAENYFREALPLNRGEVYLSSAHRNQEGGRDTSPSVAVIRAAAPVFDGEGNIFGAIVIKGDLSIITASFFESATYQTYFLTSEWGDYLLHSEEEKRLVPDYGRRATLQLDYPFAPPYLRELTEDFSQIDRKVGSGLALAPLVVGDDKVKSSVFFVGASTELAALKIQSHLLFNRMMPIVIGIFLLLVVATVGAVRRLTKPIVKLTDAAHRLAEGESQVEIPDTGVDEIGELGEAFKAMSKNVERSRLLLTELNASLEDSVAERTKELENAKLRLETKTFELAGALVRAEAATKIKDQFLATMSHEIRTPLNGILGIAELLSKTGLSDRQRNLVSTLSSSSVVLLNIVNDILDLSKIEAGQMQLSPTDFDPNRILENICGLFAKASEDKGLELIPDFILRDKPVWLNGDADRISQILSNLISNAVKFTEEGEVVARARIVSEAGETILIRFEVRDTGAGIPEEKFDRLFRAFEQLDSTTTRKHGGTGLGLTISKRLAELLGGWIGVESTVGQGTTFSFEIPLAKAKGTETAPAEEYKPFEGARILLIEPNRTVGRVLTGLLRTWGAQVNVATDVRVAEATIARNLKTPYRAILVDTKVLAMGDRVLDGLRNAAEDRALKIALLVPSRTEFDSRGEQVDGLIHKPIKQVDLNSVIYNLLAAEGTSPIDFSRGEDPGPKQHRASEYPALNPAHVLIAEDAPVNQLVVSGHLDNFGLSYEVANNGREAVDLFLKVHFDAVLMDISMPEMDGYQATREIRRFERTSGRSNRVPIIGVTAHALEKERRNALDAGMDLVLIKPLRAADLHRELVERVGLRVGSPATEREAKAREIKILPSPTVSSAVSVEALQRLRKEMGVGIGRILDAFNNDIPNRLKALNQAVGAGDASQVREEAHRLKGMARNLGFNPLGDLCYQLEVKGREMDLSESSDLLALITTEAEKIVLELKSDWVDDIR